MQVCKFRVGSYSHGVDRIVFITVADEKVSGDVILDYSVEIQPLKDKDRTFYWAGAGANFSIAGMEVHLYRHKWTYIIQYYISSGLFVIVSWVGIK